MVNFNAAPYFDDYDEAKGFYKILFRPSVAVQARELNQMQTILQKQIERFGSHIFKEGSIVLGGAFDVEVDIAYVKASEVVVPVGKTYLDFAGKIVKGAVSGVKAYVRAVEYDGNNDVYAFMVRYTKSSATTSVFAPNEIVNSIIDDGNDTVDASFSFNVVSENATGIGSIFSISQGAMFFRGYFIAFPAQTIVLEKYSDKPTATVGMKVTESIVTEIQDESLLDNALGSYNENAPGAHRYSFTSVLTKVVYGGGDEDPDFVTLFSIKEGLIERTEERTQYSRIYEELAKRTFDESGDYYVRGLNVITREHLNVNNNEGLYTEAEGGNSSLISVEIDPGVAYVKGYEKNVLTTQHIITEKSTDFATVNESAANVRTGGYVLIKEATGSPILDTGAVVNLYATAEFRVTNKIPLTTPPTSASVGTARIKGVAYEAGTLGTPTATIRVYLYDVNMTTGAFSSVKSIGVSGAFFADVVLNNAGTAPVVYDQNQDSLIVYVGSDYTKSLKDELGGSDTSFLFMRTSDDQSFNFNGGLTGIVSVSVATTGEVLAYSDGNLSAAEKRELLVSVKSSQDFLLPGTVSVSGNVVSGVDTFFDRLNIGDRVKINAVNYYVSDITSNTSMNLATTGVTVAVGNSISKAILAGDIIDLTARGSSGATRTANVLGGILSIDLKEDVSLTTPLSMPARVSYRVSRPAGAEVKKTLKPNVYVQVNCASISNTSLPIPIGLPDVYKIRSIRKKNSVFTDATVNGGSDVTSQYILDNGQRDNLYDHARIVPKAANQFTTSDFLLIKLDHFESDFSSGFGYFSVDSYPANNTVASNNTIFTYEIPVYKSASGIDYDLRNMMDFRPYKAATANSSTTVAGATINPVYSATGTIKRDSNGLRLPVPDSRINLDYSYYLARRDVVVLDKNGNFSVIKGQAAVYPVTPTIPDNFMGIAQVYIAPFPSITEKLGRILDLQNNICVSNQIANIRYTMREIGVLKSRIENLEYYTALTLLEKSAVDLKIIDPVTNEDRFKNGFFVDGFLDHSLGANYSQDYNIAVDRIEQSIRPVFETDSFKYDLIASESINVLKTGNLITLPYSEVVLIDQPNVTSFRNIEQSVYRFLGVMQLTPDGDVWVDTSTVDKTIEFGNQIPAQNAMSTEYGSWQTYVTGYKLYDRAFGDRSGVPDPKKFIGSYTSYAAALAAAQKDKDGRFLIETVTTEQRTNVNTIVTTETQTQEIGSFVTSASLIPYIRPQVIRVLVQGLKANTRYFTYFDGEDMSSYVTPYSIVNNNIVGAQVGTVEGAIWRSDEYGNLLGLLRLPAEGKRFRTGTKEIIITDSPTNAIDATSYAKGFFTAQGLSVQKQNTILSTKVPVVQQEETVENRQKQKTEIFGPSCMAYSFKVDVPEQEEGVFLTSVDVFIESMHPTLGVWFEIREMNSAGGITRNQVPYSEVWMRRDDSRIKLNPFDANRDYSIDPLVPTRVNFPSPVFLYNNTQYAFVIHTEGLNPDTYFYVSRLGENDLRSGTQVTSRRLTGNLYTTNNNLNYDIVQDVDLTVKFNRASFAINSAGTAVFGNKPTEFFSIQSPATQFSKYGEKIVGSNKLTLSNIVTTGNTIAVTDKLVGVQSNTSANITSIAGSFYFTDGFTFSNNETVVVRDSANTAKNVTATIASVTKGEGNLRSYSESKNLMIIDDSNGMFFANCKIKGEISNTADALASFKSWPYSTTNLKPHYLKFNRTSVVFEKAGFDLTAGTFSEYISGNPDSSSDYDTEMAILSRYTELSTIAGSPSSKAKALMTTASNYVSPVIDVSRANAIYVYNIINNDDANESLASGGNLINKYISKTVTLADRQDAEDLIVKLTAYRPPGSTVKVWMKIKNAEDGMLFEQRPWVELKYDDVFSSKANKNNFIELNYSIKPENLNGNGVVYYVSNGVTYTGFKQFAIKIGLMGTNSALVPRVGDLRVIALQK